MKILIVTSNLKAIGGIQKYQRTLKESLQKMSHSVATIEVKNTLLLSKIWFVVRCTVKILLWRPDFIICSNINYSPLGYWAKKILGVKYSVHLYGIESIEIKPEFIPNLKMATCLVVPFELTAHNIIKQLPETISKILVIPNPIDDKEFFIKEKSQKLIERHNLQNYKIILTITRLSFIERDNKGYEKVIRAIPQVLQSVPNTKYLLVGGGDDFENMSRLIKEMKLEGKVILSGPAKQEEMVDYYNLADVFVLPSQREGFPALVLLESLACGKPVIGGNQEGADKALLHGELGLIVEPDKVTSITQALINVLTGKVSEKLLNPTFLRTRMLEVYGEKNYLRKIQELISFINQK